MVELTPQAFAERWSKSTLSERASYQQHFLDLCAMLGQPTPAEVDPTGEFYTFEKGVEKIGGGKGFADVWYKDHFAIEYKGKHRDLNAAYQQLLQYHESLENPPLLVVTDLERFEIHTKFTGTVPLVYRFTNRELPEPENLRVLRAMFEDPYSLRPTRTVEGVTEEAARRFAQLADGLRERGIEPQRAAHFLNKLLFCLFAEDIGLLPKGLFTRVVERTRRDPERFTQYIGDLFGAMATGGDFLLEDILYFNGGLFSDRDVVPLTRQELGVLIEAARLDWGSIEPAIFGTLFERSLDPSQRARLGAHYTSRKDILTIVEPVLMAPLRREWESVQGEVEALSKKIHTFDTMSEAKDRSKVTASKRVLRQMEDKVSGFLDKLRRVRILDPACGSGNFLYVSLRELLNLEKEIATFAAKTLTKPLYLQVSPEQLYGIETNPYAHELAQVAIWIGYLQWMIQNGYGSPPEPILGPMTNITEMDALIAREDGQLREPEWPEADVIVGNPPFLGGNRVRTELGGEYVNSLFELYKGRIPATADLVCYWFERAREQIECGRARRAGLLATNSIRGGVNRRVLQRIRESGNIFFAESDRPWILSGAAVRVSMVGFDDGMEQERLLNGAPVTAINSDLTGDLNLASAKRLKENKGLCFYGSQQKGSFDITPEKAEELLSEPNSFGLDTKRVVKPAVNGAQLLRGAPQTWVIDFGVDMPLEEAALYEAPFEYTKRVVYPERRDRSEKRQREYWWLHARPSPRYRQILENQHRYVATPTVSKHRVFVWLESDVLADHQLVVFAFSDDYSFGVLHSRAHELWALRMGTSLEDRPRYTPTSTFETFPLPWPPGKEPSNDPRVEAIAESARRLDELRHNWLNPEDATAAELKKRTLTNLYNAWPTWLQNAHERLDQAVFAAYGWPPGISDEKILKNLLALNLERSLRKTV